MKSIRISLLALTLSLLIISCNKDNDDDDNGFPFYFTATIDGNAVKYEADDISSQYECGISMPENSLGMNYDIYQGTVIQDGLDPSSNAIYVHILKYFNDYPTNAEKLAMYQLGSYPYGKGEVSTSTVNGASITYYDNSGKTWSSELGTQSGSTFSISEISDNEFGTSGKIFKASFSCKLYDGMGGSITVSNATIRGKVFLP